MVKPDDLTGSSSVIKDRRIVVCPECRASTVVMDGTSDFCANRDCKLNKKPAVNPKLTYSANDWQSRVCIHQEPAGIACMITSALNDGYMVQGSMFMNHKMQYCVLMIRCRQVQKVHTDEDTI